jgi:curved DNA-binding protein CbpA
MFVDYYKILEIDSSASLKDIKTAFRKTALKWHPDRNEGMDTTEKMQLINEAYLILKDTEAKAKYDIEYKKYITYQKQRDILTKVTISEEYIVVDEILSNWMNNAKKQAVDLAKQTIKDFKDIAKEGAKGATRQAGSLLIGYIILAIVIAIISAIVGQCN